MCLLRPPSPPSHPSHQSIPPQHTYMRTRANHPTHLPHAGPEGQVHRRLQEGRPHHQVPSGVDQHPVSHVLEERQRPKAKLAGFCDCILVCVKKSGRVRGEVLRLEGNGRLMVDSLVVCTTAAVGVRLGLLPSRACVQCPQHRLQRLAQPLTIHHLPGVWHALAIVTSECMVACRSTTVRLSIPSQVGLVSRPCPAPCCFDIMGGGQNKRGVGSSAHYRAHLCAVLQMCSIGPRICPGRCVPHHRLPGWPGPRQGCRRRRAK